MVNSVVYKIAFLFVRNQPAVSVGPASPTACDWDGCHWSAPCPTHQSTHEEKLVTHTLADVTIGFRLVTPPTWRFDAPHNSPPQKFSDEIMAKVSEADGRGLVNEGTDRKVSPTGVLERGQHRCVCAHNVPLIFRARIEAWGKGERDRGSSGAK